MIAGSWQPLVTSMICAKGKAAVSQNEGHVMNTQSAVRDLGAIYPHCLPGQAVSKTRAGFWESKPFLRCVH